MQRIPGRYHNAGESHYRQAIALLSDNDQLQWLATDSDQLIEQCSRLECTQEPVIPGLPAELITPSGARFIPDDSTYRWSKGSTFLPWLESHLAGVLLALLVIPAVLWLTFTQGIPATARWAAPWVPDVALSESSQASLKALRWSMPASELPEDEQARIIQLWQQARAQAGLPERYSLVFMGGMQVNAFALPDGTLVLLDALVERLSDEQILAVLFHEAGHVDLRHGAQIMIKTSLGAALYSIMLADIEGLGEIILGGGTALAETAFNREMEHEADDYALTMLPKAGISPAVFGDALSAIAGDESMPELLQWLSTHPDTQARIQDAQEAAVALGYQADTIDDHADNQPLH